MLPQGGSADMSFSNVMRDHVREIGLIDEALTRFRSGNPDPFRDPISNEIYTVGRTTRSE